MVDNLECEEWTNEDPLPDVDDLYMRAHKDHFVRGEWQPGVFRERPKDGRGMSTNWSKYASAQVTRLGKAPEKAVNNGVLKLNVGAVNGIEGLGIAHDPVCKPEEQNRAHALVHGVRKRPERIRTALLRASREVIKLHDPVEY